MNRIIEVESGFEIENVSFLKRAWKLLRLMCSQGWKSVVVTFEVIYVSSVQSLLLSMR